MADRSHGGVTLTAKRRQVSLLSVHLEFAWSCAATRPLPTKYGTGSSLPLPLAARQTSFGLSLSLSPSHLDRS